MGVKCADFPDAVRAVMPLRQSTAGGSGSFMVLGDDNERYWCKSLNNFQSARLPITEQIVARLGGLIDAPVCQCKLVVLDEIVGWEIRQGTGRLVEKGYAHGSRAVEPTLETREMKFRSDDDNRRRHCGLYALCDWLYCGDLQWLRATDEDNAYYSHDHGFFLTGLDWTRESLASCGAERGPITLNADQLDPDELGRLAGVLESLTLDEIETAISGLPTSWPVSDEELAAVAQFADMRKAPVAARIRSLVP
jgi:hypothetical protein